MQYGDIPCCRTECPATTADTTAELGCKPGHCAVACACRLIRPAADRGCVFLRCRNHAVTMAHRAGGCHAPWAVFLPYRLNDSPCFFKIRSTSHFLTDIPAGPWLANTTAVSDAKRHGKRLHLMRAVVLFVSFKILGYSILTGHSAQRNFMWHKRV